MRETSPVQVHKVDFISAQHRIKKHLAKIGKDTWESYRPLDTFGYVEVVSTSPDRLYDRYLLNTEGVGQRECVSEINPAHIPFYGENGSLLDGTYCYSRDVIIHSRYHDAIDVFATGKVVSLDRFINPPFTENYELWNTTMLNLIK